MRLGCRQRTVLEKLHRVGPMTITELARSMDVDRSIVTRAAHTLERYGLIRRSGTKDVRGKVATLWEAAE